ncbi:MAG: hypothetical protein QOJ42_7698 [Acidobacteriaceae bacterium]|nr:hypothetical protein [Acidobacteriaceae bacterium]
MTKVILIDNRSDVCRLYIFFYIWCAAYHAAGAMQYNISGRAHCLSRHLDSEADYTAYH